MGASTSGCGKQAATGDSVRSITVRGVNRTYLLKVPSSYRNDRPLALYFVYHGSGGDHNFMVPYGFQNNGIAVYPDGQPQQTGGPTGWDQTAGGNDVAMFDSVLAATAGAYCVDTAQVYAVGFSWGGWMANALGCLRAGSVNGIASIEGGVQNRITDCVGPIPAWIHHYQQDPAEPFTSGQKAATFFQQLDATTSSVTWDAAHSCVESRGRASVVFCSPPGANHAVPDFSATSVRTFFEETRTVPTSSVPVSSLPAGLALGAGLALAGTSVLGRRRAARQRRAPS